MPSGGSQRVRHGSFSVRVFSRLLDVRTSLGFLFSRKHQQRVTYSLFVRLKGGGGCLVSALHFYLSYFSHFSPSLSVNSPHFSDCCWFPAQISSARRTSPQPVRIQCSQNGGLLAQRGVAADNEGVFVGCVRRSVCFFFFVVTLWERTGEME